MDDDAELLTRLRSGDESMLRLAATFVPSIAVAEEVVQDTWLGVLRGISAFQGRSSVKTWLFRILVNRARTAGARERRTVPLGREPAVDPARFGQAGQWASPPQHWAEDADDRIQAAKVADRIRSAIADLPPRQRQVVTLRDLDGLDSTDVCSILRISAANQRVLLHRGRSRLRQLIETEVGRI